jgi:hypothetical protein
VNPIFPARILHPAWYRGHDRSPPYFEGWYYKLVDATGQHRYAIIPGIFMSDDPEKHHAFVQVLNGMTGQAVYYQFPAESFRAAHDRFEVNIGANRFTQDYFSLQLAAEEMTLYGEVHFEGLVPWPVTPLSPGIMGPFAWLPNLQCYHGVLGLDHGLRGKLAMNEQAIDWDGGRGYIEKDWGAAFPAAWIWMQTNHFGLPSGPKGSGTSLTASVAIIPWYGLSFRGQIAGLWHQGRLYRFTTYTGARIERLEADNRRVIWVTRGRTSVGGPVYRLEIEARRETSTGGMGGGLIRGPSTQDMGVRVAESLSAQIEVRLSRLRGLRDRMLSDEASGHPAEIVFEGTGRYAGLEVEGDVERLLAE